MNLKALRNLAKSEKAQSLYRRAKESGMIKLFKNEYNLSKIQEWFLYWLEVYNLLYKDLVENKPYISEEVIKHDIRTDAYLLLRASGDTEKQNKNKKQIDTTGNTPSILFKRK